MTIPKNIFLVFEIICAAVNACELGENRFVRMVTCVGIVVAVNGYLAV